MPLQLLKTNNLHWCKKLNLISFAKQFIHYSHLHFQQKLVKGHIAHQSDLPQLRYYILPAKNAFSVTKYIKIRFL